MDIKWKDGEGNILNANNKCIKYLEAKDNVRTVLQKEEIKKITIEDGMMHLFRDFKDDLVITIVIPKGMSRNAVKIYNEYDKTGTILKRKSNDFLMNLYLESSIATGNPFFGFAVFLSIIAFVFLGVLLILYTAFGDVGFTIARFLMIGYLTHVIISFITLRIKRKIIAEKRYYNYFRMRD